MSASESPALLIVDVQHDFCPGGALAVRDGDRVVPPLRHAAERFAALGLPVYASRDWHPADSTHFAGQGGSWPVHCVQGTAGARLREDLELPPSTMIVSKGQTRHDDGYSAIAGEVSGRGSLLEDLQERGITHLYVGGLATDYCVKHSVLDALSQGYEVTVLTDAIRAVDVSPGDGDRALAEMVAAGARLGTSPDLTGGDDVPDPRGAGHAEAAGPSVHAPDPSPMQLDRVVHDRIRLGILAALALNPSLTFTDLKRLLGATDGNLTVHGRRLEDAGYITCTKTTDRRLVRTTFALAPAGRAALRKYLAQMRKLVDALG